METVLSRYMHLTSTTKDRCVGVDSGANHCVENQWRCSLHRRGWSATRGRTVRDLEQGKDSLPDGSDGPIL
jgi:hypothetical protein